MAACDLVREANIDELQARDALVGAWRLVSWENQAGFVAYASRYSSFGDRVIHHVELSLFPNWVGNDQ